MLKEDKCSEEKERDQDYQRVDHVTEKAGHLDLVLFGDRLDHKVGGVADVGIGAHKHRTD